MLRISKNKWFYYYNNYVYGNKLTTINNRINNKVIVNSSKSK